MLVDFFAGEVLSFGELFIWVPERSRAHENRFLAEIQWFSLNRDFWEKKRKKIRILFEDFEKKIDQQYFRILFEDFWICLFLIRSFPGSLLCPDSSQERVPVLLTYGRKWAQISGFSDFSENRACIFQPNKTNQKVWGVRCSDFQRIFVCF